MLLPLRFERGKTGEFCQQLRVVGVALAEERSVRQIGTQCTATICVAEGYRGDAVISMCARRSRG